MIPSNISSAPVHFEGDWTEPETAVIESAVAETEGSLPSDQQIAPWVAVSHASDSKNLFVISRVGVSTVVTAQSVTALAEEIRALNLADNAHFLPPHSTDQHL